MRKKFSIAIFGDENETDSVIGPRYVDYDDKAVC